MEDVCNIPLTTILPYLDNTELIYVLSNLPSGICFAFFLTDFAKPFDLNNTIMLAFQNRLYLFSGWSDMTTFPVMIDLTQTPVSVGVSSHNLASLYIEMFNNRVMDTLVSPDWAVLAKALAVIARDQASDSGSGVLFGNILQIDTTSVMIDALSIWENEQPVFITIKLPSPVEMILFNNQIYVFPHHYMLDSFPFLIDVTQMPVSVGVSPHHIENVYLEFFSHMLENPDFCSLWEQKCNGPRVCKIMDLDLDIDLDNDNGPGVCKIMDLDLDNDLDNDNGPGVCKVIDLDIINNDE